MPSNIFNSVDCQKIIHRLQQLNPSSSRKWGSMNVEQMLTHCNQQLLLALGDLETHPEGPALYRTALGRWLALYAIPWSKGVKTPAHMDMLNNSVDPGTFESARKALFSGLERIEKSPSLHPHPFFGALNRKDWGRLIWKHLDHHLRQFDA